MNDVIGSNYGVSTWDIEKLARFCEVCIRIAMEAYSARINALDLTNYTASRGRLVVLEALEEESEKIVEKLIILALDKKYLNAKQLKSSKTGKKAVSQLILEEDDSNVSG